MIIVVVEPAKEPYVHEIDGSLESMQKIVGGDIEAIYLEDDSAIVVNGKHKVNSMQPNRVLKYSHGADPICGTFFVCYAPIESESFESVPDPLIFKYINKFKSIIISV